MSIVQERLNVNKPPPPAPDPKSGKLVPGQINGGRDLDVDPKKDEPSFFGSFFSTARKGQPKKALGPLMESVSTVRDDGLLDSVNSVNPVATCDNQTPIGAERARDHGD
ncbi:hypothetical protein J3R83DRAFT_1677 [Lanmaoa asiatica]|nr:hypothetical protein J3R83DRAFT_1677 [Lanmaoa asiatica]